MDTNETNGNSLASAYREAIQREKEQYQKARENEPTFEFTAPSGAKFILRNPKLQTFQLGGSMPFSITSKMLEAMGKGGGELTEMPELTQEEHFKNIISAVDLVLDIVVAPRIVEVVENPDEEISQDEILMKDFIVGWFAYVININPKTSEMKLKVKDGFILLNAKNKTAAKRTVKDWIRNNPDLCEHGKINIHALEISSESLKELLEEKPRKGIQKQIHILLDINQPKEVWANTVED